MMSFARKPRVWVPVLLFSLAGCGLAGCGLKGPLYLPDERQEEVAAPNTRPPKPVLEGSRVRTLPPAPQSQKKDRERGTQSTAPATEPQQSLPPPVSPPDPDRPATTPLPPPGR